jgi:hypothetical protein
MGTSIKFHKILNKENTVPHDLNGKLVKVGQIVSMKFRVTSVSTGEEYCNANLESVEKLYPATTYGTGLSSVNTRQFEVIQEPEEVQAPAEAPPA